jgi:esterase/lipase superfamily enzyme
MAEIQRLIVDLEQAVAAGDKERAFELARQAQRLLYAETGDVSAIEQRLETLLELLYSPPFEPLVKAAEIFGDAAEIHDLGIPADKPLRQPPPRRAPTPEDPVVYPVWFGTNRKPDGQGGFGHQRSSVISRGKAEVFIPKSHRFGETGNAFWKRLLRFEFRDDHLKLERVTPQESADFYNEIQQVMQHARDDGRAAQALFFLHGYNVSFEEAAIRAAQIGFDLKVPGATAFFSWPSRGRAPFYPLDEAAIEASEQAITDFLVEFTQQCGADKVHIIAHSMGNRGLLRALQRIASKAELQGNIRFGQIFLAAPDVDRDLFMELGKIYPQYGERTTLYASRRDLPIRLSNFLHGGPRAGYYAPYTVVQGVDTIAVPNFNVDFLGHSYFAQAEALLNDIFDLMRHNEPPSERQRLAPVAGESGIWCFKR